MAVAALALYAVFVGLTVGVRVAIQVRRTGSTGFNRLRGRLGSVEWVAGVLFVVGVFLAPAGPILDLLGVLEPIGALDTRTVQVFGLILAGAGTVLVFLAQLAMGDSWRIGVEPEERTELVTGGIFGVVRNPIFATTIPMAIGFVLMVPNAVALIDLGIVALSIELLVRAVEEPYLQRTHGDAYRDYASRVGRFLPGVGLIATTKPGA
jgi:protein-S-isoprenylcysteine O-methyltransferase Ste14